MDTPVPIPNTAVKHLSADNTWLATARESKSLPDLYESLEDNTLKAFFVCKESFTKEIFLKTLGLQAEMLGVLLCLQRNLV